MKNPVERVLAALPVSEPSRQLDDRIDRLITSASPPADWARVGRMRVAAVAAVALAVGLSGGFSGGFAASRWMGQPTQDRPAALATGVRELQVVLMPSGVRNPFDFSVQRPRPIKVSVTTNAHQGDNL